MLRLITDFDGPIMDVSERYYHVYQLCLERVKNREQPVKQLSKAEFWQLKRARILEKQIAILSGLDEAQAVEFARLRREMVHRLEYLHLDSPIPDARETLAKLQFLDVDLVVMTMRRVNELVEPLQRCDLDQFFPDNRRYCLGNNYIKTTDVKDKPLLMARAIVELPAAETVWMVGDTEADIAAAKSQNIKIISVLSGIRDRPTLESYEPDAIVNNLKEAVDLILLTTNTSTSSV
jgi:phosphoglycolate phosphatase-like HAD superfamily hydrolase